MTTSEMHLARLRMMREELRKRPYEWKVILSCMAAACQCWFDKLITDQELMEILHECRRS